MRLLSKSNNISGELREHLSHTFSYPPTITGTEVMNDVIA